MGQFGLSARVAAIAILVAGPLVIGSVLQLAADREAAQSAAVDETGRLASLAADTTREYFDGARQALIAIAEDPEIRDLDPAACTAYLRDLLPAYPDYVNLAAADAEGNVVCSAVPTNGSVTVADRSYFTRAMTTGSFAIGDYSVGRVTGTPVIVAALPIHADAAAPSGIVLASLPLTSLARLGAGVSLPEGAALTIVDRNGTILVREPHPEDWVGQTLPDVPHIAAMLAGEDRTIEAAGVDGTVRLYAIRSPDISGATGIHVSLGFEQAALVAAADRQFWIGMGLILIAASVALVLSWIGVRGLILRPVAELSVAADRIASGDLEARTGLAGGGEFGALAATFDRMAASVQERVEARTTDLSSALAQLQEREARLAEQAALVDGTRDGLFVFDPETIRFSHVNQGAIDQVGYSRDDLLAMTPLDIKPRFDEVGFRAMIAPLVDGRQDTHRFETVHRRKDGTELPVEVLLQAVRLGHAQLRLVAVVRDISERVAAEHRTREYLDIAVDPLTVSRAIRDDAGEIVDFEAVYANDPAARLVGKTYSELGARLSAQAPELVAQRLPAWSAVVGTGQPVEYDAALPHATTGETRDLSVRITKVGDGVAIAFRDITAAKQLQRALESARAEAERANRSKTEFLSRMSHELRTPLNAVIGFAQLLELERLPNGQRDSVGQILRGGRHLLELINEVLDISRIESGTLTISPEPVSVREAVRDVMALIEPLAKERGLRLETTGLPQAAYVQADRQRLRQVLLNLLSNAVKFNRPGGAVILAAEPVAGPDGAEHLRVSVTDQGAGIDPAMHERVFAAFDRLGAERSGVEGTGLGLSVSKALLEAMGGRIGVESARGNGTTFWFSLPLVSRASLSNATRAQVEATPMVGLEISARERTLLYIEDNPSNFRLVELALERRPGFRLIAAMLGGLGLELAHQHRPDLVLLDLHLPDLEGEEVLTRLRADPATAGIPVVVLSAEASPRVRERLMAIGATDYLAKPIDLAEFYQVIDLHAGLAHRPGTEQ